MLSAREYNEFLIFASMYPIDDRSNFQMPSAAARSDFLNVNRGKGREITLRECLLFKGPQDEPGIDELLMSEGW